MTQDRHQGATNTAGFQHVRPLDEVGLQWWGTGLPIKLDTRAKLLTGLVKIQWGKKTQARCETTSAAAAPLIFDKNFDEWRNWWEQCCGNVATTSEDKLICDRKHLRSARSLFQTGGQNVRFSIIMPLVAHPKCLG